MMKVVRKIRDIDGTTIAWLEKEYPIWKPKVKAKPKNMLFDYLRVKGIFLNSTMVGYRP